MTKVKDILKSKGNEVYSVAPDISAYDALQIMSDKNVGALLVTEKGKLTGIFSERDYARKVVLKGRSSKDTTIAELMTINPFVVSPDHTIEMCMGIMSNKSIRHLPVVEHDDLVGVISISDVVRTIIEDQKYTIDQLENFIKGI